MLQTGHKNIPHRSDGRALSLFYPLLSQYTVVLKALRNGKIHHPQGGDSAMGDSFFIFNGTTLAEWTLGNILTIPCNCIYAMARCGWMTHLRTLKSDKQTLECERIVTFCETGSSGNMATKIAPKTIAWGIYGKQTCFAKWLHTCSFIFQIMLRDFHNFSSFHSFPISCPLWLPAMDWHNLIWGKSASKLKCEEAISLRVRKNTGRCSFWRQQLKPNTNSAIGYSLKQSSLPPFKVSYVLFVGKRHFCFAGFIPHLLSLPSGEIRKVQPEYFVSCHKEN